METTPDQNTHPLDAVVLAAGMNKVPLFAGYKPGYKALLPFAGKPSIQYPLEALCAVPEVRRILVVGPETEVRAALAGSGCKLKCEYVPGGESPMESVLNVLPLLKDSPRVLFATGDLPLVSTESIRAFLDASHAVETGYPLNIYLSAVLRTAFTGRFATSPKGHMVFRGGRVYHGNLALIEPKALETPGLSRMMDRLYRNRKNPVGMALSGGWRIALSYVLGAFLFRAITMDQMARIASARLGVGIVPVVVPYPEIAIDVDEPYDYELVSRELEARVARPRPLPGQ